MALDMTKIDEVGIGTGVYTGNSPSFVVVNYLPANKLASGQVRMLQSTQIRKSW